MNICVVYLHSGVSYCMLIDCRDITSCSTGNRSSVSKHANHSGCTAHRIGAYCRVTRELADIRPEAHSKDVCMYVSTYVPMYVYMYAHMYMCMYAYASYAYVCLSIWIGTNVRMCMCVYIYICICTYENTYEPYYVYMCVYVCVRADLQVSVLIKKTQTRYCLYSE
jgi:hypothetical protein